MSATLKRYGTALRCYDNGGRSFDRYTVIPPRWAQRDRITWDGIAASESPFHPQGFGQHVTSVIPGSHLGRRIRWDDLPADVQRFARQAFPEYAFDVDTIARHFCIAALWADADEGTQPRLSRKAQDTARAFVIAFLSTHPNLSDAAMRAEGYGSHPDAGSPAAAFGHDLYLTAAGHGAGFDDRKELNEAGDTGYKLAERIRKAWRRWYVETYQARGFFYIEAHSYGGAEQ